MKKKIALPILLLLINCGLFAQISSSSLDSLVTAALTTFDVPGIAVGIVKDGKIVHAKGYGVRSLSTGQPVNENTLFGIASNSKAFTCMALAMLADSGKLSWDDKVRKFIPEFKLYDPYVTEEFTIRDLVTHRSGLGLGAGDLMFFPEGGDFTVQDIINNLRFLKPVSSFRSKYEYNNNLYIVAGEVIRRVSGLSWAEFIEQRIMKPIGFSLSKGAYNRVQNNLNIIDAHAPVEGKAVQIPHDWNAIANAAGGIMSNITDMAKWANFWLNDGGTLPNGKRLFSKRQLNELWRIQTPTTAAFGGPYNTGFSGYGLGWVITDVAGKKQVGHTGGLIGTVTQFTLIPELNLGIIVLTNQQQGAAFTAITNTIKDSYLGYPNRNWLKTNGDRYLQNNALAKRITDSVYNLVNLQSKTKISAAEEVAIAGNYKDDWMGNWIIEKKENKLIIRSVRSPRLTGELLKLNNTVYVAKWNDRSYDADAYVNFTFDNNGKTNGFKMEAISPATDFSFDFHDMDVKRIN